MMHLFIQEILSHLFVILTGIAILAAIIRTLSWKNPHSLAHKAEAFLAYLLLLPIGIQGLYIFIMHAIFPDYTAQFLSYPASPFQFEIAAANLGLGITGILAFRAKHSFRVATSINAICFLWGAAVNRIQQMVVAQNFAPGNSGAVFYTDLILPLLLVILLVLAKKAEHAHSHQP